MTRVMRRLWRITSGDSTMREHDGGEQRLHQRRTEQLAPEQQNQQRETELSALAHDDTRCAET